MPVERTLQALAEQGIQKCHIMVFGSNESGLAFWKKRAGLPARRLC